MLLRYIDLMTVQAEREREIIQDILKSRHFTLTKLLILAFKNNKNIIPGYLILQSFRFRIP